MLLFYKILPTTLTDISLLNALTDTGDLISYKTLSGSIEMEPILHILFILYDYNKIF